MRFLDVRSGPTAISRLTYKQSVRYDYTFVSKTCFEDVWSRAFIKELPFPVSFCLELQMRSRIYKALLVLLFRRIVIFSLHMNLSKGFFFIFGFISKSKFCRNSFLAKANHQRFRRFVKETHTRSTRPPRSHFEKATPETKRRPTTTNLDSPVSFRGWMLFQMSARLQSDRELLLLAARSDRIFFSRAEALEAVGTAKPGWCFVLVFFFCHISL